ncbi:uncharacterized mitochondrial protein AtMg00810-like [Malania oleifera]|uniref:uncharacterized mitochondrial protein AtMg00810-like n=1 Tax=Malania oleifera TaxID=397392 RepID=UPI0025AE48D5|nr:uncharacterized mitochondrial protein AtMg00810-like [Malania oleifera]
MIITGDDTYGIHKLKQFLCRQFEMKDLSSLHYFLGLEVSPTFNRYSLTQAKYASDPLTRAGLTDCKITYSLPEPNIKLHPANGELLPYVTRYRQLVGSLIYLTVTRPYIAYAEHLDGTLRFLSVSSVDQLADIFTKSHPPGRHHALVYKLQMSSSKPP